MSFYSFFLMLARGIPESCIGEEQNASGTPRSTFEVTYLTVS